MEKDINIIDTWYNSGHRTDYFDWGRKPEDLHNAAKSWNARSEQGQTITFELAEGLPPLSKDVKQGGSVYWTGYITTIEGGIYKFVRLDAKLILSKAAPFGLTWQKVSRPSKMKHNNTKFKGVAGRNYTERSSKAHEMVEELDLPTWLKEATVSAIRKDYFDFLIEKLTEADAAADKAMQSPAAKLKQSQAELQRIKESVIDVLIDSGMSREDAVRKILSL